MHWVVSLLSMFITQDTSIICVDVSALPSLCRSSVYPVHPSPKTLPSFIFFTLGTSFFPSIISPFSPAHLFPLITYSLIIFIEGSYCRQDRCLIYTAEGLAAAYGYQPLTPANQHLG